MKLLRRIMDAQLSLAEKGKPLEKFKPLFTAMDTFFFEYSSRTTSGPHIRDAVDLKRWMILVVFALIPCVFMAVWNTGAQKLVYGSQNLELFRQFQLSCHSLSDYCSFFLQDDRWKTVIWMGLQAFLPVMIISYAAGGLCEAIFACVRGHEIAEGFLVSGILFALILPPTIPYWMVAFGVIVGIVISKELFGGTGMNIVNPALFCRIFLFFSFPAQMSGDVWVGTNPVEIRESIAQMNRSGNLRGVDGISQATALARLNIGLAVKRIHVAAIENHITKESSSDEVGKTLNKYFSQWNGKRNLIVRHSKDFPLHDISRDELKEFITDSPSNGGLGLSTEKFEDAWHFAELEMGRGLMSDWNFFFGNKLGCMGETSTLGCLLGALFMIWVGVASWRVMAGVIIGTLATATLLSVISSFFSVEGGAWSPAVFTFPAYKHLLMGGLAFGLVFMATDPVSSTSFSLSKWIYGALIGCLTVVIRVINPAFPEGFMLAAITANVAAPLIDHLVHLRIRMRRRVRA